MTAYPSAPVPTPMTIEPIIMVYPLRSGQVGALSSVSEVISSTFASKKTGYMRSNDCVVSASIAEWPETRTTVKTPAATSQSSPFMVSLPIEPQLTSIVDSNDGDSILPQVGRLHFAQQQNSSSIRI